jgi:flagellar biogenesis protein FliO
MQPFVNLKPFPHHCRRPTAYTRIQIALLAGLAVWAPSSAAADGDAPAVAWPFAELVIVALVMLLGWAIIAVLKRRMRALGGGAGLVQVVSATALGARERVVVLRAHGRLLLVGVTAHNVSLIADLGADPAGDGALPAAAAHDAAAAGAHPD